VLGHEVALRVVIERLGTLGTAERVVTPSVSAVSGRKRRIDSHPADRSVCSPFCPGAQTRRARHLVGIPYHQHGLPSRKRGPGLPRSGADSGSRSCRVRSESLADDVVGGLSVPCGRPVGPNKDVGCGRDVGGGAVVSEGKPHRPQCDV